MFGFLPDAFIEYRHKHFGDENKNYKRGTPTKQEPNVRHDRQYGKHHPGPGHPNEVRHGLPDGVSWAQRPVPERQFFRFRTGHFSRLTLRLTWRRPETIASSWTWTAAHVQPIVRRPSITRTATRHVSSLEPR